MLSTTITNVAEFGSTFVIVVFNIVSLAVLIVVFGYLIYRCRRLD